MSKRKPKPGGLAAMLDERTRKILYSAVNPLTMDGGCHTEQSETLLRLLNNGDGLLRTPDSDPTPRAVTAERLAQELDGVLDRLLDGGDPLGDTEPVYPLLMEIAERLTARPDSDTGREEEDEPMDIRWYDATRESCDICRMWRSEGIVFGPKGRAHGFICGVCLDRAAPPEGRPCPECGGPTTKTTDGYDELWCVSRDTPTRFCMGERRSGGDRRTPTPPEGGNDEN